MEPKKVIRKRGSLAISPRQWGSNSRRIATSLGRQAGVEIAIGRRKKADAKVSVLVGHIGKAATGNAKGAARLYGEASGFVRSAKINTKNAAKLMEAGKRQKGFARKAGVLGMLAVFNAAIGGKKKDKRG